MEIESFDDLDELFRWMERDRHAADARVQPWQAVLMAGNYYQQETPYGFLIYGEILADPEPREHALRHYRFCRAYSLACPRGELGNVHVSVITRRLEKTAFDAARGRGWLDGC